jgi:hypothetical protein
MMYPLLLGLILADAPPSPDRAAGGLEVARRIDDFVSKHWDSQKAKPAGLADDAAFLRRLYLDLVGRPPTAAEARIFIDDKSADKRQRAVAGLMASPEYPLHLGRVLDEIVQDRYAGDAEFLAYLRDAVAQRKPWDQVFREVILGPWDTPERKKADRFLVKRMQSLDDVTNDTARSFFGVNVSCAKCHDHPLAPDWKQDHYYGMASFFSRTLEANKGKKDTLSPEKNTGEVSFVTVKGEKRTARMMFLSSEVFEDTPAKAGSPAPSRREVLVKAAVEEKTFLRRAIANRLWAWFIGRGLVHPVDQMHSGNVPAIPDLLEWLGDDFAAHGYDLDRLVAGIVSSRVYQLASTRDQMNDTAGPTLFNRARLRPLTPQQYALALLQVSGEEAPGDLKPEASARRWQDMERQAAGLTKLLDPRTDSFQSSAGEALFVSNHPEVQKLFTPSGKNLVARLTEIKDNGAAVDAAVWTVLARPPEAEERAYLVRWLNEHQGDHAKICSQLAWALATSAEFRFNH